MAHLEEHKLLSDNMWDKILDKGGLVDTFIMDIEKAFNTNFLNVNYVAMALVGRF